MLPHACAPEHDRLEQSATNVSLNRSVSVIFRLGLLKRPDSDIRILLHQHISDVLFGLIPQYDLHAGIARLEFPHERHEQSDARDRRARDGHPASLVCGLFARIRHGHVDVL